MDARTFDKSKLPSRHVTEGPARAPHRSYYYAMGLTEEQIHRPFVGVVSCWNEAAPCNIALMRQAQSAKKGVNEAGGTPREFCTITVTDGIAMGHQGMKSSLVSREVIADSIELTMRGHCYDGMVGLAGCDKSLPGVMMAMLRLNVPAVFMYGGSILPGKFKGQGRDGGRRVRGRRSALGRQDVGRRIARAGMCRLPRGRRLRRAVHRQHHGDGVGGDRAGVAGVRGRAGALREPRRVRGGKRQGRHAPAGRRHPPARHRHPQGLRERGNHRRRHRRLHQRRPAPARHGARVRHRVRPDGCLRHLQAHALHRRPEAFRKVRRQRCLRYRRQYRRSCARCSTAATCTRTA